MDLLEELEGFEKENPYEHVSQLKARIQDAHDTTVQKNKAGDKKGALECLREKKALEKELQEYLLEHPGAD